MNEEISDIKDEISDSAHEAQESVTPTPEENEKNSKAENCDEGQKEENYVDYAKLISEDIEELRAHFPEARGIRSITALDNPLRYAALRDLGLTAKEAYLATQSPVGRYDNRSHLRSSVPRGAEAGEGAMSPEALIAARELFSGLTDREIQKLYKKVNK